MKLLILTSCTGEKVVESPDQLTLDDFRRGVTHVAAKEKALKPLLRSAEDLYSGLQHIRLMKGVRAAREAGKLDVELQVLSAGYGLVSGSAMLAPYEATFAGMKGVELREWARALRVPQAISKLLAQPRDLTILLLGEDYLKACELGDALILGAPTIALCSGASANRLPDLPRLHKVVLTNADAKRFRCGMVGLKGEVASRVLSYLSRQKGSLTELLKDADHLLHIAEREREGLPAPAKSQESQNSQVDWVIKLPKSWQTRSSSKKLTYFIPDWDDQVDPDFDFATETHSGGTGEWSNQVYAHQMFKEPNYDGILISKIVAEQSKKKAERINRLGVHRHLRVPRDFPVMGDCGAFGYINEYAPPFDTQEILDYYTLRDKEREAIAQRLHFFPHTTKFEDKRYGGVDGSGDFPALTYADCAVYFTVAQGVIYQSTQDTGLKELPVLADPVVHVTWIPEDDAKRSEVLLAAFASLAGRDVKDVIAKSDFLKLRAAYGRKAVTGQAAGMHGAAEFDALLVGGRGGLARCCIDRSR